MREIKFRAWSGEEMYKDFQNSPPTLIADLISGTTIGQSPYIKGWILMQFTGLHDKNGKAIYEGDVVEWDSLLMDCITTEKRRVEIKYVANYHEYLTDDPSRGVSAIFTFPRTSNAQTIEVVGNIYENPNLITGKKDLYE